MTWARLLLLPLTAWRDIADGAAHPIGPHGSRRSGHALRPLEDHGDGTASVHRGGQPRLL